MAKTAAPRLPLWALLVGSELLDLLCFGFAAIGLETFGESQSSLIEGIRIIVPGVIPWSHGLLMSILWTAAAAGAAQVFFHDRRASVGLGLVVFSHWVLDFIVHLPDLPLLFNNSPRLGLGLWGSGPGLILSGVLEIVLLAGGFAMYMVWRRRRVKSIILPEKGRL